MAIDKMELTLVMVTDNAKSALKVEHHQFGDGKVRLPS